MTYAILHLQTQYASSRSLGRSGCRKDMLMKKKGFIIYYDMEQHLRKLTNEQIGILLLSLIAYGANGTIPHFDSEALDMLFSVLQLQMDRDAEKYEQTCTRNKANARKRWHAIPSHAIDADTDTHTEIDNPKEIDTDTLTSAVSNDCVSELVPSIPTVEELRTYCNANQYQFDYMEFYNHYASNGWMIGKNPMVSWHAAADSWEARKLKKTSAKSEKSTIHNFPERSYDYTQLEDKLLNK